MAGVYSTDQQVSGLYGGIVIPSQFTWTTTSSSFTNFSGNSYTTTPVLTGNASIPSTKIPGITFSTLPPGNYLIIAECCFGWTGASGSALFRFSDGTNSTSVTRILTDTSMTNYGASTTIVGQLSYGSLQSNITLQIQSRVAGPTTAIVFADAADLSIQVYRMPILLSNAGI